MKGKLDYRHTNSTNNLNLIPLAKQVLLTLDSSLHARQGGKWRRGVAAKSHTLLKSALVGIGQPHAPAALSQEMCPIVRTGCEAGWVPQLI